MLTNDIVHALIGNKRDRFILGTMAYDDIGLANKRKFAMRYVRKSSMYAGINGVFSIPDLGACVDVSVLKNLSRIVAETYGLTEEQRSYAKLVFGEKTTEPFIARALQFGSTYLVDEGVKQMLNQLGTAVKSKWAVKLVPIAGNFAAGGLAFVITYIYGRKMVGEAEGILRDLAQDVRKQIPGAGGAESL